MLTVISSVFKVLSAKIILVSSAKRKNFNLLEQLLISLMYNRKTRDRNTEPCGTAHVHAHLSEIVLLFATKLVDAVRITTTD